MKTKLIASIILLSITFSTLAQVNFVWGKQLGTEQEEKARNITSDSFNNVYLFGKTEGLIGKQQFGKNDGFITKIDSNANILWSVQVGLSENDDIKQACTDVWGNVYITGQIGIAANKKLETNDDILVAKISQGGEIIWQKTLGTDSSEVGSNIAVDSHGSVYVFGNTKGLMGDSQKGMDDCFLLKLDKDGNEIKTLQFGSQGSEWASGISFSHDSLIYLCGSTTGLLGNEKNGDSDVFWGIVSIDLELIDLNQFGTSNYDFALLIRTDTLNNIYIAGNTGGDMANPQKGEGDSFLMKMNKNREVVWKKQFGSATWDGINGLEIFNNNEVIVSGCLNYPLCKSFIRLYASNGNLLWEQKHLAYGKAGGTCGKGVSISKTGLIYHGGYTGANLFTDLIGKHDLFVTKYQVDSKNLILKK